MHRFKAAGKYIASFFLSEWRLEDYPLKTTFRGSAVEDGRRKPLAWTVQVINWWHMRGDGDTQERALENLRERLVVHKAKYGTLPRPGRGAELEVEFAQSDRIQRYEDIAAHFFPAVLEREYGDCLVSDESSLWDFYDVNGRVDR